MQIDVDTDIDAALSHHESGRIHLAEAGYRKILEHDPDEPDALNLLGLILQERGDLSQSIALISRALEIVPEFPEALTNLARARRVAGEPGPAAEAARRAILLDPELAEAHLQLGHALIDLGDNLAASSALGQAAALAPRSAEALWQLGIARLRLKDYQGSTDSLQTAWDLGIRHAEIMGHFGAALGGLNRSDEALAWHERAVQAAPDDAATHAALAVTLRRRLDPVRSITACRRTLELAPERVDIWLLLGANLAATGAFAEAEACFRKVLELQPDSAEARRDLSMIGLQSKDATEIARLQAVLIDPTRLAPARIAAGFALGTLLDSMGGNYDAAFAAFEVANRLTHASLAEQGKGYDEAGLRAYVDWAIATFQKDSFAATADWGDPSDAPVFIVGMPRSGTSLVEQILASHCAVFGAGERKDIGDIIRGLDGGPHRAPQAWGHQAVRLAATHQLATVRALGGSALRVIDKMPDNALYLGAIAVLFPNARIIICQRDLRDVCLSCYCQPFGDGNAWTFDLVELASRAREIDRLLNHWRTVLPLRLIDVRYEDVVADLEGQSRRLVDFLGLAWDPACLAFHATERPVMTASYWQVRQALYGSSVGRWRHYRSHLGPLLLGLAELARPDGDEDWDAIAADSAAALRFALPLHHAGRLDLAEPVYHALLRRNPDDAVTLHLLGLLRIDQGNPTAAAALITRSLELRPDTPPALADLARARRVAGDADGAAKAARRAVALDPMLADAHVQLGCALSEQQDFSGAIVVLRRAIELAPRSVEAWIFLASALHHVRDFSAAADAWQSLLALVPDQPDFLVDYAAAMGELHRYDEALEIYRKAAALSPGHSRALQGIGWSLLQAGDAAGAVEACRTAVDAAPGQAELWLTLANSLAALGRFHEAAEAYRHTLALDPESGDAMTGLGKIGKGMEDRAERDARRAVLLDINRPNRERVTAGFAVGNACDRLGDYDAALDAYQMANRLLRADRIQHGVGFDRQDLSKLVDWLISNIGPETFVRTAGWGDPSELPVFIVGMPRSGTSLVEQIAASHPKVFGAGERRDFNDVLVALDGEQTARPPVLWDRAAVRREATRYVDRLRASGHGAIRIIDKLPDNVMWLGQIAVLLPRARIVMCRRDTRDVCLSNFFQYFQDDAMVWADDLGDCAFRACEIERLMAHWCKVLPFPFLEVQYETLVAKPEIESRRLIDFLGLDWDPACLAFHETERTVLTASHWQVRQPLYASSVGRWRNYRQHLEAMLMELKRGKQVIGSG